MPFSLAFAAVFTLGCNAQVQIGDVIYIEANSGSVKRVGRCDTYSCEYDLEVSSCMSGLGASLIAVFDTRRRPRSMCRFRRVMCTKRRR